jgi:hypothetical protein
MNIKLLVTVAVTAVGLMGVVENASAAVVCPNGGTLTGPISGGVLVPNGSICTLTGATVSGGVRVAGGTLISMSSTISGGLHFENAIGRSVICSSRISGGVIVQNSNGEVFFGEFNGGLGFACPGDTISGGVLFQNNTAVLEVDDCTVSGGVVFLKNKGVFEVERSTISGGLSCSNNTDAVGTPNSTGFLLEGNLNIVSGGKLGQCATGF